MLYAIIGIILTITTYINWIQYRQIRRNNIIVRYLCIGGILFLLLGSTILPIIVPIIGITIFVLLLMFIMMFCKQMLQTINSTDNDGDRNTFNRYTDIQRSK